MRIQLTAMLLGAMLASAAYLGAQTATTGQITGTIHDPSGAVIAGAKVVLTSPTGQTRATESSGEGYYRFSGVEPGEYSLEVTAAGFATYTATGITVGVTQTADVSPQMQVGAATTNVQVTERAPLVQTENPTIGRVVEEQEVHELPLPTRNYQQLLGLQPGTTIPLTNNIALGRGDVDINVNGQQATSNNVLIDGIQVNSIGTNSTPNIPVPSIDAVKEFIVQTSLYDATQGRNLGGNVALVTKSGGSQFHGSVFEYFRNDALNANDYFLKQQGQPRPALKKNQYGATLGGPLVKEKTFFFLSYQGQREVNGADPFSSLSYLNVPSGLTNDRSTATLVNYANSLGLGGYYAAPGNYPWPLIYRWPTPIDPTALALLQAKLPNGHYAIPSAAAGRPCSTAASALFSYSGAPATFCTVPTTISTRSTFDENQFDVNLDQNIGSGDHFSGKFFSSNSPEYQGIFSFLGANANEAPGYGAPLNFRYRLLSLDETHVFSPSLLNDMRIGFSRIHGVSYPTEPFTNPQMGIYNSLASRYSGLATIGLTGDFTVGPAPLSDQKSVTETFMYTEMVTWNKGRNSMRFGFDVLRHHVDFYFHAFTRGEEIVNNFGSFLLGGNDANAALGGLPGNITGLLGDGVPDRGIRMWDSDFFFQDDFRLTPRLMLNAGLRLNRFGGPSDIHNRMVNFLPGVFAANNPSGCTTATASCTGTNAGFVLGGNPLYNNQLALDPRVGFAWQPPARWNLTVRGGFGVYHDRVSSRIANLQIFNYPYDIVGAGFGNLETPFPNFTGVTFPMQATVPAALPLYYYNTPLAVSTPISGYYVNPKFASPYAYQYSLSTQVEPWRSWLVQVAYVGVKGVKLLNVLTLNQYPGVAPFGAAFSTNKAFNGLEYVNNSANSEYNSLQASLTKRMDQHLQMVASYTFGKSIDNYSGAPENELAALPGNQNDPASQRGLSDYDRKHRLVLSGLLDEGAPFKGGSRLAATVANNWQMASIMTFQSGTPYSVNCIIGSSINSRADYVTGTVAPKPAGTEFNPNAYQCDAGVYFPPYGNTPRNFLRGPGQKNVDLSIIRNFPIKENSGVQFRAELFNVGNWENFNNPNNNIAVPSTAGTTPALSASGPRVVQFVLKYHF